MKSIESLNPRHYRILELCLRGWTNKQIAEHLNMNSVSISYIVRSPNFQHELAIRRSMCDEIVNQQVANHTDEITKEIEEAAREAVKRLRGGIASDNEAIAVRSSDSILDRAGYGKIQKIESRNLSVVLTAEDAARIVETIDMDKE